MQASTTATRLRERSAPASLVCSVCGYGVARSTPPGPCPMCRAHDAWRPLDRLPFGRPFATEPDADALFGS